MCFAYQKRSAAVYHVDSGYQQKHDTWRPGEHTGTFRGNQLAMVSGAKALEIIQRDNLVEHARIAGQYLRAGLEKSKAESTVLPKYVEKA